MLGHVLCCSPNTQCAEETTLWLDYECVPRLVLLGAGLLACAMLGWAAQSLARL